MNDRTRKLTFSALYLAIALVLPFITGQIPEIGAMLSPMHIPVLLEGKLAELSRIELLLLATEEDDLSFWELEEPTKSIRLLLERLSIRIKDDDDESSLTSKGLLESSPPQATKIKLETKAK